jgi:hypothetical protein
MPNNQPFDIPNRSEDYLLKVRDFDNEALSLKATTVLLTIIITFAFIYALINKIGEPLYNFLGLVVTPLLTAFSYMTGKSSGKKEGAMEEKLKSKEN